LLQPSQEGMPRSCLHYLETRHYLVGQTIHIIFKVNPLQILMMKTSFLNSRLANWVILLSQHDMTFEPQKAIKGQVLADFFKAHPVSELQRCIKIS